MSSHSQPCHPPEDERMRQVLDTDEFQRVTEVKYSDNIMLQQQHEHSHHDNDDERNNTMDYASSTTITESSLSGGGNRLFQRTALLGGLFGKSSEDKTAGKFHDWPDNRERSHYNSYSRVGDDHDDDNDEKEQQTTNNNGILSVISVHCLPGSAAITDDGCKQRTMTRRKSYLSALLLGLIVYGSISMVADVVNSISNLHKKSRIVQPHENERFPGGFVAMTNNGRAPFDYSNTNTIESAATATAAYGTSQIDMSKQTRSFFDLKTKTDNRIDTNNPTIADIPHLTEQILSTTFQHVLEYTKNDTPYANEIPLFWTFETTMDHMCKRLMQCFPNVVQASGGTIAGSTLEEAIRKFPMDVKLLQQKISLGEYDGTASMDDGGKYVNVDLFTPQGVQRAADLRLLFPSRQYPLIREHDYSPVVTSSISDTPTTNTDANTYHHDIQASSQINLLVSPFLPETVNGLFSTATTTATNIHVGSSPPKAKVHAIMLPTSHSIRSYHSMHLSKGGTSTFLEFITSPSILVNNYVTRILSGQWEEGSQVTEVHLEVAKNIISRKIHMWPNRGVQDMFSVWANTYGWEEGALKHREQLLQQMQLSNNELVLGMECLFPPPDPNLPPPVHAPPPAPSELDIEINRIISERNALDDKLFLYVIQLYDSWMA